jgi:hypothetical protein
MENDNNIIMSRFAFERMQAKDERNDRWRNIIIVLLIVLLVATNGMWLWAWNQYDYTEENTTVRADGDSNANYIGRDGTITNGGDNNSQTQDKDKEERPE